MNYRKTAAFFFVMIAGGLAFNYLLSTGRFPVAFVGLRPISARALDELSAAAMRYYENVLRTYGGDLNELNRPEFKQDVRRAVFDKLIDDIIIRSELRKRIGKDLDLLVRSKLDKVESDQDFQHAAATLYGLEPKRFRRIFLVPQAEREILEGRLVFERREMDDWLAEARRMARVTILSPEFKWGEEGVEPRN